jgi:hypothetical protein
VLLILQVINQNIFYKIELFILGMSTQDLLQKDVKQVSGPNIRLLISTLPSEYTVEVIKKKNFFFFPRNFVF